jgi:hypothetical protein
LFGGNACRCSLFASVTADDAGLASSAAGVGLSFEQPTAAPSSTQIHAKPILDNVVVFISFSNDG